MYQILLVTFLVVAVALVAMILIQHGKGADMGASFGAGASNTVFGSSGSGNFLTRTTGILAMLFFATALALGYMTAHNNAQSSDMTDIATQISSEEAAIPAPVVETGIPTADIEDVAATEASAIPDASLDETIDAIKEIPADKVESTKDPIKDQDK